MFNFYLVSIIRAAGQKGDEDASKKEATAGELSGHSINHKTSRLIEWLKHLRDQCLL